MASEAASVGNGKWSVAGLVKDVKNEHKDVDLKYSIQVIDGGKLDPIIIVDK